MEKFKFLILFQILSKNKDYLNIFVLEKSGF